MSKAPDWLKPGALCTTRDGRKVRILATDLPGDYPVGGWAFGAVPEKGVLETWGPHGSFSVEPGGDDTDLTGPWVEKLPELKVGMIVQLRDGSTARILCLDALGRGRESVVALHTSLSTPELEVISFHSPSGRWNGDNNESRMDMMKVIGRWVATP